MDLRLPRLSTAIRRLIEGRRSQQGSRQRRSLLAPRWLASVDVQMNVRSYRIRQHWNGTIALQAAPLPTGEPCYLVLHPGLPFRRKLQRFPAQARAREVLLRAAPDEFPLAGAGVSYCLGLRQGEGYVYALPADINQQLDERCLQSDIVLVGATDILDQAACQATIAAYECHGASLAFGGRRPPLPRRWLLDIPLAISAAMALALTIWLALGADPLAELSAGKLQRVRLETATAAGQYAAVENMLATRNRLVRLRESPGADVPAELARLWQDVPAGHAIRRIEYKEGNLMVSGSGVEVGKWLEAASFAPEQITTETVGKLNRFRAERKLVR